MTGGALFLQGAGRLSVAEATQGLHRLGTNGADSERTPTPARLWMAGRGAGVHCMSITAGLRKERGPFLPVDEVVSSQSLEQQ